LPWCEEKNWKFFSSHQGKKREVDKQNVIVLEKSGGTRFFEHNHILFKKKDELAYPEFLAGAVGV